MSIKQDAMKDVARSADAQAEADRWLARSLSGDYSAAERTTFERWREDPRNAAAYANAQRLWSQVGQLAGNEKLERMVTQALHATPARERRWTLPLVASIAACVVAIGVYVLMQQTGSRVVTYATAAGERSDVTLADGSHLILNSDTTVSVRLKSTSRELTLQRGEALFDVQHDAGRVFRVTVGSGEVTAIGTRFDIRKQEENVTVTLLEGKVAVGRPDADGLQLQAGEQASFTGRSGAIAKRKVDTEVVASWSRGRLLFRATPLAEVIAEVNRYAPVRLRLIEPSVANIPVSGTFPIGDSRSVALGLQALLPIRASAPDERGEILLSGK